ncbi:MAG: hypothetical protein RRA35_11725 [Desulfomonilia bacterium]|nr:hypothetical protein [Desulfomonilia bacterium]
MIRRRHTVNDIYTLHGVPFSARAGFGEEQRRFIEVSDGIVIYARDWGHPFNSSGQKYHNIRDYTVGLDLWCAAWHYSVALPPDIALLSIQKRRQQIFQWANKILEHRAFWNMVKQDQDRHRRLKMRFIQASKKVVSLDAWRKKREEAGKKTGKDEVGDS